MDGFKIRNSFRLKYAHNCTRRRCVGPFLIRAAKKTPKGVALTFAGIPIAYHNLGPPSYECPGCHAIMWYEERNDKAKRAVNPTFSLCCREDKELLPLFNETPPPLKLPHAHILLWLEERWKCRNPAEIDDIISVELPSPIEDPKGYKVVTDYMLHGPCSVDAKYAPFTTDGKCSKHFPKSILAESVIDEDGYAFYRRMNNKVTAKKGKFVYDNKHVVPYNRPLQLWEENWVALLDDILHKKQKLYRYPELQLTEEQLKNYCLLEIQELLNRHGKSLREFQDLPQPNPSIASLLLPGGRTAHSRFVIPLELMENNTCGIKYDGVAGGDFRQILLVIPKAKRPEDEPTWIQILEEFLIKSWNTPIEKIVLETYPDFTTRQSDDQYLKEREILTPRNDDADAINEYMFNKLGGETVTYNSANKVYKHSTYTLDHHNLYPVEFLNSLNFPGMPPHALSLKKELPIMLIRNVDPRGYAMGLD
nr:ATP-dependent DNA helicase PIF1-like [Tanacetum cinerariifolium]